MIPTSLHHFRNKAPSYIRPATTPHTQKSHGNWDITISKMSRGFSSAGPTRSGARSGTCTAGSVEASLPTSERNLRRETRINRKTTMPKFNSPTNWHASAITRLDKCGSSGTRFVFEGVLPPQLPPIFCIETTLFRSTGRSRNPRTNARSRSPAPRAPSVSVSSPCPNRDSSPTDPTSCPRGPRCPRSPRRVRIPRDLLRWMSRSSRLRAEQQEPLGDQERICTIWVLAVLYTRFSLHGAHLRG